MTCYSVNTLFESESFKQTAINRGSSAASSLDESIRVAITKTAVSCWAMPEFLPVDRGGKGPGKWFERPPHLMKDEEINQSHNSSTTQSQRG